MNSEGPLQVHRVQVANVPQVAPLEEPQTIGAATLLHRRLRGRYPLAITLAVVFGAIGVVAGYLSTGPQYTSEALIRVFPTLPRVLYKTEENEMPPLFGEFVASQAQIIESPRVFAKAAEDEKLREIGWPAPPDGISKLKDSVSVNYRRGTQIIIVEGTTDTPIDSQRAVNAVVDAYMLLYGEASDTKTSEREGILKTRRADLERELSGIRDSILSFGAMYGSDQLDAMSAARMGEMLALEQDMFQVKRRITTLEAEESATTPVEPTESELSVERLAKLDVTLGELVNQRGKLDVDIESAQRFGPRHMQTRRLLEDREALNKQINSRAELVRSWIGKGSQEATSETGKSADGMSLTQAKALLARLTEDHDLTNKEVMRISKALSDINAKKEEAESVRKLLAETVTALEQISVEKQNSKQGRIDPSPGDLPTQPSKDRRLQLAALGGMAGAGFGLGLVLLFGLLRPSYRYLDEIEEAETLVPVLGTLPNLNSKDDDLESLATLSVHHLRNMLAMQARPRKQGGTAFMITSARPGDGKTSLTVALGMSFAAQGAKVLMIDADLIGHGLSPTMRMDGNVGLRQAAGGGSLDEFIFPSRITNLSVLPAGLSSHNGAAQNGKPIRDGAIEAEHLSNERMNELLDQARTRFDIILVDTGPLMGSLEANVLATAVDRVVLTVPRGQDPRLLRAALGRLRSIGATCGGLVFNRATASDLRSSMSTISFHSQSMRTNSDASPELSAESRHALVRAILMSGQAGDAKGGGSSK